MEELSLLYGDDLHLDEIHSVRHPTLRDIKSIGYEKYLQYVYLLISNSKDVADILWVEGKVWYEDIESEWEFFIQQSLLESKECDADILLDGEHTFGKGIVADAILNEALCFFLRLDGEFVFIQKAIENSDKKQIILVNAKYDENSVLLITDDCFKFTEYYYNLITQYLKDINWIKIDYLFLKGGNKWAKTVILKQRYKERKSKSSLNAPTVTIGSIISSIIAKGTSMRDIWDFPIYLVYDIYYRQCKIENYNNTMSALYSGGLDTKKNPINWEKINWSSVLTI